MCWRLIIGEPLLILGFNGKDCGSFDQAASFRSARYNYSADLSPSSLVIVPSRM